MMYSLQYVQDAFRITLDQYCIDVTFFLHAHPVLVNLIVILFFHHVSSTA